MAASKLQAFWNHPAGPKTIHFWAPTFKWVISIANVADFSKPPENISYPQQFVVACSGVIWSRYSLVIKPGSAINKRAIWPPLASKDSIAFCKADFMFHNIAEKLESFLCEHGDGLDRDLSTVKEISARSGF